MDEFNFSEFFREYRLIFIVVLIIVSAIVVARVIRFLLKRYLDDASEKLKIDPTRYKFYRNAIDVVIYMLAGFAIIYSIPQLRTIGTTLFAGAGIFAAILGLASQEAFSNIIGGIFIVIFKPFRVNDIIKVGTNPYGFVEDITLRHTVIKSFENRRIIIPNSIIGRETILNSSIVDERLCNHIDLGISYDSNIDKAMHIIREEAMKHPLFLDERTNEEKLKGIPAVDVRVLGYSESAVQLRASVWTKDHITGFDLKCDLYKSIKERFDVEGVHIPATFRTVVVNQ
jgi:small-conductance mechanosensitive channel